METEDGYILKMHRILPKNKNSSTKPPVILMHGMLCTSADYILLGPYKALGFLLSNNNYDVWLGNNRGNTYSFHHKTLNPKSKKFWDFSFHELGYYDLSRMIDYVLEISGKDQLFYVGHSQGTTQVNFYLYLKKKFFDNFSKIKYSF